MKRFYKMVTAAPNAGGYEVHLDGKPVKLPSGGILRAPTKELAEQMALEWAAQKDTIDPESMPLTQLCITAQDRVTQEREAIMAQIMAYLDTDLVCYRAGEPPELAQRLAQLWDPWVVWFADEYGVALQTTTGLTALRQPPEAAAAVKTALDKMDVFRFTAAQAMTGLSGSLILAMAFMAGKASPEQVYEAMHAEELYKASIYNEAFYGAAPHEEKKRASVQRELAAARKFLDLL